MFNYSTWLSCSVVVTH